MVLARGGTLGWRKPALAGVLAASSLAGAGPLAFSRPAGCGAAGSGGQRVVEVAAGAYAGYALLADGQVMAWGDDLEGQLGDGRAGVVEALPVRPKGLPPVVAVAGGGNSAFAVTRGGALWGWGDDSQGQLGWPGVLSSPVPVPVPLPAKVAAVSAGAFSVYAIGRGGTVWSWGDNSFGQLGNGPGQAPARARPGVVRNLHGDLHGALSVVAGSADAYALGANGQVWAFGDNSLGQLGQGRAGPRAGLAASGLALRVPGLSGVVQLAAGGDTVYALRKDGSVWAWGDDGFGELGNGTVRLFEAKPAPVAGLAHVVAVAAGASTGYALRSDGTVWAWGRGTEGELGDGQAVDESRPVRVRGLSEVVELAADGDVGFALDRHGVVWSWGAGNLGQLGDGGGVNSAVPVRVVGLASCRGSAGLSRAIAARAPSAGQWHAPSRPSRLPATGAIVRYWATRYTCPSHGTWLGPTAGGSKRLAGLAGRLAACFLSV